MPRSMLRTNATVTLQLSPGQRASQQAQAKQQAADLLHRFDCYGDGHLDAVEQSAALAELKRQHKATAKTNAPPAAAKP